MTTPLCAFGLQRMLATVPDLSICCEADSGDAALRALEKTHADLAIVDLSLGDTSGLDLIRRLHDAHPDLRILVLFIHDEALFAERALRAGARD